MALTKHELVMRISEGTGVNPVPVSEKRSWSRPVRLAATSTNAMIKRLGGKRWRALHQLAYVAAISGALHYYLQVKKDVRLPLVFAVVLVILLGRRLVEYWRRPS